MTDEEKKAIKEVKHFNELTRYWQEEEYEEKEIARYIRTILNLIEKQSKEIEELKVAFNNCFDECTSLRENFHKQIEIQKNVDKKWEDKIKAKIEEIEKRRLQDGECELALHGFQREAKIEVLQSLLEKE